MMFLWATLQDPVFVIKRALWALDRNRFVSVAPSVSRVKKKPSGSKPFLASILPLLWLCSGGGRGERYLFEPVCAENLASHISCILFTQNVFYAGRLQLCTHGIFIIVTCPKMCTASFGKIRSSHYRKSVKFPRNPNTDKYCSLQSRELRRSKNCKCYRNITGIIGEMGFPLTPTIPGKTTPYLYRAAGSVMTDRESACRKKRKQAAATLRPFYFSLNVQASQQVQE